MAITQQKRVPKGHAGGGRWTKGGIPPAIAGNKAAYQAYKTTRQATAMRIKAYKIKRKLANATGAQKNTLAAQYQQVTAMYGIINAQAKQARAAAKKQGYHINASGKLIKSPQTQPQQPPPPKPKAKQAAAPQQKPVQPKPPSQSQQIQDGIDAFKEHRKWRVKAIALKKKADSAVSSNAWRAANAKYQAAVQKRDAAKAKLDAIRKSLNASGQVKFKSNGDVFVKGVQTHKGGTPIAAVKTKTGGQKQSGKPQTQKQPPAQQNVPLWAQGLGLKPNTTSTPKKGVFRPAPPADLWRLSKHDAAKIVQNSEVWEILNDPQFQNVSMVASNHPKAEALRAKIHGRYGLDAKPRLTPRLTKKIVNKILGGGDIVYRGVTAVRASSAGQLKQQFTSGKMFMGIGIYGNGTYSSTKRATASMYAGRSNDGVFGAIIKMAIPKDAKYVSYDDISRYAKRLDVSRGAPGTGSGEDLVGRRDLFRNNEELLAMALGYDGIYKDFSDERYYITFNRGQLLVEK